MNKNAIAIESNLNDLKHGDHIFSAEFVSTGDEERFDVKEFEFIGYLDKNIHIEGIDQEATTPAEIFDVRFPKVKIKTDISYGYFITPEKAKQEFVAMLEHILQKAKQLI